MTEKYTIFKHKDLNEDALREIIRLKQQHWNHPYESQKKWIEDNLQPEDIHMLYAIDGRYIAYMSICIIDIFSKEMHIKAKGLGNVCVDKELQGKGLGKRLVEKANELITDAGEVGILLCHNHLLAFYERCGWHNVEYNSLLIGENKFNDILMLLNCDKNYLSDVVLDRNF